MVLVDKQNLLDGVLLEAHLVELGQQVKELLSLRDRTDRKAWSDTSLELIFSPRKYSLSPVSNL